MAGRGKLMAVLLAVITVLALGGCFKKSMSPGAGAAETTAANATEAVREEAAPLHTETEKEDETAPAAEENEERAADGPGADAEDAAESGAGVQDIEAFAERIQEAVADRDMEALADLSAFPLNLETADGEKMTFEDRDEFLKQNPDLIFGDDLMVAIAGVDTATLEANADGVTMGEENPHIRYKKTEDGTFGITDIRE
ncbi:hypothetical protein NQ487_20630 [Hungatella hathewayi]|jgi:hypothetical protein|uniref:Uncharacterized protein n=2 Tax=Hungatella hathewayi TaxID=154046 RepID=D3ALL3_9FIRM|nr:MULTISPECIES: hypothetical protein [Hungatella]MCD7995626.1 hypothetical protein [Clostridiales bacterium]EFC97288.1 hypothetical protein CLOSTHATH_04509 [Hungatella hathewayi DSM 13479]MBS6756823.1 hypothetical protein [Hungatella hathewayi]MCQ4831151.1 hypothetical protein [Hungatella sp. SL.1.14]MUB62538.1 hypothetical protein [Hungatella hathewayi]